MSKELNSFIDNSSCHLQYPFSTKKEIGPKSVSNLHKSQNTSVLIKGASTVLLSLAVAFTMPKASSSLNSANSVSEWHWGIGPNGWPEEGAQNLFDDVELDSPNWLEHTINELEHRNFKRINDPRKNSQ